MLSLFIAVFCALCAFAGWAAASLFGLWALPFFKTGQLFRFSAAALAGATALAAFLSQKHIGRSVSLLPVIVAWYMALAAALCWVVSKLWPANGALPDFRPTALRVLAPLFLAALMGFSVWSAYSPAVRRLTVSVGKPMERPLKLALVTDMHMGRLIGNSQLQKLQAILDRERPDALLLGGDTFDDRVDAYFEQGMADNFKKIASTPPLGTYAVLGNHDVYFDRARIEQALREAGATLLADETATLGGAALIGRRDDFDSDRLPTAALLKGVDLSKPVLLLEHRPTQALENAKLPVDAQFSGHTHGGQIFPGNILVKLTATVSRGAKTIDGTTIVVSQGFGLWGLPFRLGSRSEVWIIDVVGQSQPRNSGAAANVSGAPSAPRSSTRP